jgi:hypothetical protein
MESDPLPKIVLRCVATVCRDLKPAEVWRIAEPLIEAVTDAVVFQHELTQPGTMQVKTNHYVSFELFNRIIDEIAKEIPCADKINVWCENMSRAQRREYIDRYGDTSKPSSSAETL